MKFTYASGQQPLDGYTIKRGISCGGFGEVYYGVSDGGKEVALKLIRSNVDIELRGMSQCLNFKHPNLVGLFDLRTDRDGDHWVVMEYVAGETLQAVLSRHPIGMAPELAKRWFLGVAAGVGYLHDHGVVHRDLKPSNIFMESGNVKVGDFGLARFISGSQRHALTQSIGTVYYMAPEISTGNYNKQVDLYAAGILLYEMLTGHVPFEGDSAAEILMKHLTTLPDLSKVPAEFRPLIGRALTKNAAQRYASMAEMVHDIEAIGGGPKQPQQAGNAGDRRFGNRLNNGNDIPTVVPVQPMGPSSDTAKFGVRTWVGELVGSMAMSAVLTLLLCVVWAGVLRTHDTLKIAPYFFLTLASTWAVLVPAKMWASRVNYSLRRRASLMCLGLLIGVLALWLEGFDLPGQLAAKTLPAATPIVALADGVDENKATIKSDDARHWYSGGLLVQGQAVPSAACYLAYFGSVFFLIRWWKLADRRRPHRFSFSAVCMAALGCWVLLLFIWPAEAQANATLIDRTTAIMVPVMASVVIQMVSPWEAPEPRKCRKLRLAHT